MKIYHNLTALLGSAVLLSSCATTPVAGNFTYNEAMPNALVIVGIINPTASSIVSILPVDPATCRSTTKGLDTGTRIGFGHTFKPVSQLERRMIELPPGSYVVADTQYSTQSPVVTMQEGTKGFTIKAGDLVTLGEFGFARQRFAYAGNRRLGLKEFMAQYPNIAATVKDASLLDTTFTRDRNGERLSGCGFKESS